MRLFARSIALSLVVLSGCAVIKTTDITDASFKRHQSVSVLGWPIYSRVTDKEPGLPAPIAERTRIRESDGPVRAAEMFGKPIELDIDSATDGVATEHEVPGSVTP